MSSVDPDLLIDNYIISGIFTFVGIISLIPLIFTLIIHTKNKRFRTSAYGTILMCIIFEMMITFHLTIDGFDSFFLGKRLKNNSDFCLAEAIFAVTGYSLLISYNALIYFFLFFKLITNYQE